MENIPTAQEFFKEYIDKVPNNSEQSPMMIVMIEFAKLHVQAALKTAANKTYDQSMNNGRQIEHTATAKKSIVNAYSLNNIK